MAHPRHGLADRLAGRLAGSVAGRTTGRLTRRATSPSPVVEALAVEKAAADADVESAAAALPLAAAARQRIDAEIQPYIAAIAARLAGPGDARPRRAHQAIIAELHDGLWEATTANLAQGLRPRQAARAALEEFGDSATVAAAFTPELAGVQARRTALTLARTGPLIGALWIVALRAIHALPPAPPWRHALTGMWVALPPLVGLGVATAALATMLTVATTGRPSRWLTPHPRRAPTAAATVAIAAIVIDLTLLGMLAGQAITTPNMLTSPSGSGLAAAPVALAAAASITRLALSSRATRRSLAARASLA